MGVDICAIMKHNFSPKEILEIPNFLNEWSEVYEYYNYYNESILKVEEYRWNFNEKEPKITELDIIQTWDDQENNRSTKTDCNLYTGFASFDFYRNTINISPSPHHKYGNLYDFESRNYIIKLLRLVGERIGTKKIIYAADSACSTYIIEEKAREGMLFKDIENFSLNRFGKIPEKLTEAVYNQFFIDDFKLDLEDYNDDPLLFNRANEEYFIEKKFGQGFIIFRK